jgi:putative sterol carrier protein
MADEAPTLAAVLNEKVAPRFAQVLSDAQRRLEALQREVDDLRAARGTLQWEVDGLGTCYLNVDGGQVAVADAPLEAPFMTIALSRADWDRFASGAVAPGMMSGNRQGLGESRVQRLKALKGSVRFVVSGFADGEWTSTIHFGAGPRPEQPQTTIRINAEAAEKMQRGELNPQMAFMQGQVRLEGDAALAMQVGMAMAM